MIKVNNKMLIALSSTLLLSFAQLSYGKDNSFTISINSNCKIHNQHPIPNETIEYDGECKDGYAEGKGKVRWYNNGNLHQLSQATFIRGVMEGECSMNILNTKISFAGICKNDLPLNGSYTDKDGNVYTGEFENGKPIKK